MSSTLQTVEIDPKSKPEASIIWMHGLGADGYDFAGIVPQLRMPEKLAVRFVFPHAPVRPVTLNGGYKMRAWFDIKSLEICAEQDAEGIHESRAMIEELISRELALGINSERIVLAGFSQGAAMALYCGLNYSRKLAGILALSGFLPLKEDFSGNFTSHNLDIPILMLHGQYDDVVKVEWAEQSRDFLVKLGCNVNLRTYDVYHSLCAEEISEISNWLQKLFI